MPTTNEQDVARYILSKLGEISAMKLQKLLYYSQAWSLAWDEKELFEADFEAWANGPVLPSIYRIHKGMFLVSGELFVDGDLTKIQGDAEDTIDNVLRVYGEKTAQWLSNLTHEESPWLDAREDLPPTMGSNAIINKGEMHRYYSGL